jgi:hypothetical protein
MYGLGGSATNALGSAPATLYSGLNPAASAGAYGGNPLGGGVAGQTAGASPISGGASATGISPLMQMMLMQQMSGAAGQLGQQAPVQATGQQPYAQPQAQVAPGQGSPTVNPAMLGAIMSGSR